MAVSAARTKWRENAITDRQRGGVGTQIDNRTDKLMSHDGTGIQSLLTTKIGVQIRSAKTGDLDADDGVARVPDAGIIELPNPDAFNSFVADTFHSDVSKAERARRYTLVQPAAPSGAFLFIDHAVTEFGPNVEIVDDFQLINFLKGFLAEWCLVFEHMQNDTLEQVSKRHIEVFRQAFQDLEHPFLDTDTRLHSLYGDRLIGHVPVSVSCHPILVHW